MVRSSGPELKQSSANEWNKFMVKIRTEIEVALVFELCVSVQTHNSGEIIEMTCGWGRVPMWPERAEKGAVQKHEIEMKGGSLRVSSSIKKDLTPTSRFGRFKGLFGGNDDPVLVVQEFSKERTLTLLEDRVSAELAPAGILTPVCTVSLIHNYYGAFNDLLSKQNKRVQKDCSQNYFQFNDTTSIAITNFLCIIDRPNMLCALADV